MRSASFRVLSTVVWLLLLIALALVIALVVRDNPPGSQSVTIPSQKQRPAVDQPNQTVEEPIAIRPTFTNTPFVVQNTVASLLDTKRILAGGFSFQPVEGYSLEIVDGSVTMAAPDADEAIGPTILLIGGTDSPLIQAKTESLDDAFDQFVNSFAQDGSFQVGDKKAISTKNLTGIAADLSNRNDETGATSQPFAGRVFMSRPNPPQFFVMIAIAPTAQWAQEVSSRFDAVLDSVSLFNLTNQFSTLKQPTASSASNPTPPPPKNTAASRPTAESTVRPESTPRETSALAASSGTNAATLPSFNQGNVANDQQARWRAYTNGNFVNEALVVDDIIWAATNGGVVAWNKSSNTASKFTTTNGLLANQTTAIALCKFSDLGIVFGTASGLQIFNLDNGRWSTLTSQNSLMSYDDVSDLYCASDYGFMVIGYQRHGVDIFDANRDEWLYFDRNRALVSNAVRELTVVGDRKEIWIISDLGLTVLENIPELDNRRSSFFNHENSPLLEVPINTIVAAADGSVWLAQEDTVYNVRRVNESVAGSTQREWATFDTRGIPGEAFPQGSIKSLAATTDQTVWVGAQDAEICRFDPETETCVQIFDNGPSATGKASGPLSHLFTDEAGELYYATQGNGLSHFDGIRWNQFYLEDELLTSSRIQYLAQDSDGYIWIVTASDIQLAEKSPEIGSPLQRLILNPSATQRMSQSNRRLFEDQRSGQQQVTALWTNRAGQVWLGTDNASHLANNEWQTYTSLNGLVGNPVQAFAMDNQGRVWIGTGSGLNILNEGAFFSLTTDQGLPNDNVQAIIADANSAENIVWIGTAGGGLLRFEKNQLQVFNQKSAGLPSDNVTALGLDSDGSLLIGTDNGLARLVGGRAIKIRAVGDVTVTSITTAASAPPASDGTMASVWVGTKESGLSHFNGLAWEQVPPANLPDMHIAALLVDKDGTVWIGGANGGLVQHAPLE